MWTFCYAARQKTSVNGGGVCRDDMKACKNCKTERDEFRPLTRGYCRRCYFRILKLEQLETGTYRSRGRYPKAFSARYQKEKYETELANLRELEHGLREDVDPLQVEGLICSIVKASCAKPIWLPSVHSALHKSFDQDSLNALYHILLDIVENLPSVSHTAWNCLLDRVRLSFYTSRKSLASHKP